MRSSATADFDRLLADIRACRICADSPVGERLPHEPHPVIRGYSTAVIAVCGQAPGTRVHASGLPFDDRSGTRLRDWMGVTSEQFYDERMFATLPMGFCFPGQDVKGGDLPPRRECAKMWRTEVMRAFPRIELILLIGQYAQRWHLTQRYGSPWRLALTDTVRDWRRISAPSNSAAILPLPHPSWRNTGWLKANPWFETDLVPELRQRISRLMATA